MLTATPRSGRSAGAARRCLNRHAVAQLILLKKQVLGHILPTPALDYSDYSPFGLILTGNFLLAASLTHPSSHKGFFSI